MRYRLSQLQWRYFPTQMGYLFSLGNSGVSAAWNARSHVARVANIELGTKVILNWTIRQNKRIRLATRVDLAFMS